MTVRAGPKVQRSWFADVDAALDALETRGRQLSAAAPDEVVNARFRRYTPAEQVVARLEVAGPERLVPSVRGGVDVHGDGSVQAYRGRVRRAVIETQDSDNAYAALRRALAEPE